MKPAARTVKIRRPALPPLLEIDEDGVPTFELGISEGRRWSGSDQDEPGVAMSEWPTEFDD